MGSEIRFSAATDARTFRGSTARWECNDALLPVVCPGNRNDPTDQCLGEFLSLEEATKAAQIRAMQCPPHPDCFASFRFSAESNRLRTVQRILRDLQSR